MPLPRRANRQANWGRASIPSRRQVPANVCSSSRVRTACSSVSSAGALRSGSGTSAEVAQSM